MCTGPRAFEDSYDGYVTSRLKAAALGALIVLVPTVVAFGLFPDVGGGIFFLLPLAVPGLLLLVWAVRPRSEASG